MDLTTAIEIIKNSGLQQTNKIKDLETKLETLTSCLTDVEIINQNLQEKLLQKSAEVRMLTFKLQQQNNIITAINQNIKNFHATNVALQQQLSQDRNCTNFLENGCFIMLDTTPQWIGDNDDVVSKFEDLMDQFSLNQPTNNALLINKLSYRSIEQMQRSVELLFENAISEPTNLSKYVKLCQLVSKRYVILENAGETTIYFKNLMAIHCLNEFEKLFGEWKSGNHSDIIRKRVIEIMKFVGSLFNAEVLTFKNMFQYLTHLSSSNDEVFLECLCRLLRRIGKNMELSGRNCLVLQFVRLSTKLADDKSSLCPQIRKMMEELIEFRNNNWQDPTACGQVKPEQPNGDILKYNDDQWRPDFQEGRKYYTYDQMKILSKAPAALQKPQINKDLTDVISLNGQSVAPSVYCHEWRGTLALLNAFGGLLETLEPQNVDAVSLKARKFVPNDCHGAGKCVKKLFNKAVSRPNQCELYAEFAVKMCAGKDEIFKKMLNYVCKETVKLGYTSQDSNLLTTAETVDYRLKPRLVVQFVVELFKVGLLEGDILNEYLNSLLKSSDDGDLIFLCEQLAKNGQHIENRNLTTLNAYFMKLKEVLSDAKTSEQVQLVIQDLFVLRQNSWSANEMDV